MNTGGFKEELDGSLLGVRQGWSILPGENRKGSGPK
jgi:hypothetical protein